MASAVKSARSLFASGMRYATTLPSSPEVQARLARTTSKFEPLVYYGQVTREIAKQVWTKEKLAPPSTATLHEAQTVGKGLLNALRTGAYRKWTRSDVIKGSVLAGEAFTFFLIGEMVGRRNIIGYDP
ncbi:hypothetical protein RI367_002517 [Sorochytrium milnesiophthora]